MSLLENILSLPYHKIYTMEADGRYSAMVEEFDGCFASGDNLTEAQQNLREAMILWIEAELEAGRNIPTPTYPPSSGIPLVRYNVQRTG